jgi:flagellar hook-length control protein FliK
MWVRRVKRGLAGSGPENLSPKRENKFSVSGHQRRFTIGNPLKIKKKPVWHRLCFLPGMEMMIPSVGMNIQGSNSFPMAGAGDNLQPSSFESVLSSERGQMPQDSFKQGAGEKPSIDDRHSMDSKVKHSGKESPSDDDVQAEEAAGKAGQTSSKDESQQAETGDDAAGNKNSMDSKESGSQEAETVSLNTVENGVICGLMTEGDAGGESADTGGTGTDLTETEGLDDLLSGNTKKTEHEGKMINADAEKVDESDNAFAEVGSGSDDSDGEESFLKIVRNAASDRNKSHTEKAPPGQSGNNTDISSAGNRPETLNARHEIMKGAMTVEAGSRAGEGAFRESGNGILHMSAGTNRVGLALRHEDLGRLNINLTIHRGLVDIHVNAVDRIAREYLENNMHQLVEMLQEGGVSIGGFSIAHREGRNDFQNSFISSNAGENAVVNMVNQSPRNTGLISVFA